MRSSTRWRHGQAGRWLAALLLLLTPAAARGDAGARAPATSSPPAIEANTADALSQTSRTDGRLDISELFSDDSITDRHLSYTQLRARLDMEKPLTIGPSEVHLDGRLRQSWNDVGSDRTDVSRLNAQVGNRTSRWMLAIGRQTIAALAGTQVDGLYAGMRLGETTHAGVFGGLAPNPLTGAVDTRFATAGIAYDSREPGRHHLGGVNLALYRGTPDRLFLSERAYLKLNESWTLFALGVIDFLAPRGLLDELDLTQKGEQLGLDGLDLTNAQLRLTYRVPQYDVSLLATHVHTILPNRWWTNRIQQERARLGFVVDGPDPVGTRRSGARLVANARGLGSVQPYIVARYDLRHGSGEGASRQTAAHGWEARPGIKWKLQTRFVDVNVAYHRYFQVTNQRVSISGGGEPTDSVGLDGGITAMRSLPDGTADSRFLLDVYGAIVGHLGTLAPELDGVDVMGQYQVFFEQDVTYQLFFFRVSYRLRR